MPFGRAGFKPSNSSVETSRTASGMMAVEGRQFGFRLVVGDHALGRSQGLGKLDLGEAARLPEGEEALAECGMWAFLAGMSRRIVRSIFELLLIPLAGYTCMYILTNGEKNCKK